MRFYVIWPARGKYRALNDIGQVIAGTLAVLFAARDLELWKRGIS